MLLYKRKVIMNEMDEDGSNELMDIEDQLNEEMKEAFRKRLEQRLQKKIKEREQRMSKRGGIKKKDR